MARIMRIIMLGVALAAAPSWAQVYKWADENGRIHYGEKPPANKGAPVNLRDATGGPRMEPKEEVKGDAPPAAPVPPAAARSAPRETALQRQEREFQERQEKRDREFAKERERQEQANRPNPSSCRTARRDLYIMERDPTRYTYAQQAEARGRISRYCR